MQAQLKRTLRVYSSIAVLVAMLGAGLVAMSPTPGKAILYLLPVILLAALAGVVLDVFGAVCVVLAWLPFSDGFLKFEVGIATFNLYAAGMTALTLWFFARAAMGMGRYHIKPPDMMMAGLCFTYLCSTFFAKDIVESGYLAFHALFVPVVSYFVVKAYIRNNIQYNQAVGFLVAGIVVMGLFGLTQFARDPSRLELFHQPFISIATLAVTGFVIAAYSQWSSQWLSRSVATITFLTLIATYSRAYLVAVLLSPILCRLIRRGYSFVLLTAFLITTLFSTLYVTYNAEVFKPAHTNRQLERTLQRITTLDYWKASIYGRALTYRQGLEKFEKHPILGTGMTKGKIVVTPHDFHVEWLQYGGIIGYLLYAGVFLTHFWRAHRRARVDPRLAATLTGILIILGNSFTNGLMHGIMPYAAFLLIGFGEALLTQRGLTETLLAPQNGNKHLCKQGIFRGDRATA